MVDFKQGDRIALIKDDKVIAIKTVKSVTYKRRFINTEDGNRYNVRHYRIRIATQEEINLDKNESAGSR